MAIAALALPFFVLGAPAHAAGDDTSTPTCAKGQVYDGKTKKCVKQTSAIPDSDLTPYAYALAKAGRYQEALDVLDTLAEPNTPQALNYRGYATRKLGRTDEGIGYYLQSVSLDPGYVKVREYLGEAYALKGETDLALAQLDRIEVLCGARTCAEYRSLAAAIREPGSW
jgi:tetratricopeptide (TPR) repeat protein